MRQSGIRKEYRQAMADFFRECLALFFLLLEYPVCGQNLLSSLQFTHYKTFEDGVAAWEKRKKRINYKAMYFILFDTVDGEISEKDIIEFGKIKCANKIVLSKNSYPQYDYVLTIPVRKKDSNKHYMNRNIIGRRRFESTYDYVQWINDGKTTV